jgi:membrane-anchored protein YejM (alkaline phosphatase superfamily)
MRVASTDFTHEVRRQATFSLWLMNLGFAALLGVNYLAHVPEVDRPVWLFALPALVSTVLMLTIVPGGAFWLVARYVPSARALGWIQGAFWAVFQTLLFADTRIYNMFRYHFNGQVLNLVYVRGSEDAIHLGWQVWTAITLGLTAVVSLQLWYWRRSLFRAERASRLGRSKLLKPWLIWGLILLPVVFVEKTIYARADLARDRQITHLARLFPMYARVPAEDFASVLGVDVERDPRIELEGIELDYPHARPAVDPAGPRPNVLVLVIDCLRQDRLVERHTPNVSRFAEECLRFEDHVSAGNSTRYGIFSMLYGLHGSYWFPVLNEERSPVLIDTLAELGYEFGIFGSASMGYPEMRSTVWSAIREDVHDDFSGEEPWQRDEMAADAMIAWLDERDDDDATFWGCLQLDSPHQTYSYPPDRAPFAPAAPALDYMSMTSNEGPTPELLEGVRNRYDNAVYHADDVAGRVLDAIRASSRFEDTLIVVTGDHGEEFLERGFFGHTSAFTREQVLVPFLLRGPGVEPGVERRPTSHLDFAPTLLEMLGANPAGRGSWCLGENLLEPRAERRRVMGGWNELGVWTPNGILRVPLSPFEFDVEVYDEDWQSVHDDQEILRLEAETLERLGADCNRFLR